MLVATTGRVLSCCWGIGKRVESTMFVCKLLYTASGLEFVPYYYITKTDSLRFAIIADVCKYAWSYHMSPGSIARYIYIYIYIYIYPRKWTSCLNRNLKTHLDYITIFLTSPLNVKHFVLVDCAASKRLMERELKERWHSTWHHRNSMLSELFVPQKISKTSVPQCFTHWYCLWPPFPGYTTALHHFESMWLNACMHCILFVTTTKST